MPDPHHTYNIKPSPTSSFVDLCTLHQHAMRYYRIWIYACNTVLALATLVFVLFAVSVLVDPRISLLSSVQLYQPTLLYAYFAIFVQCGLVQSIGCLGAVRLNKNLLNAYWNILFLLLIGDLILGLIFAFKLDGIKSNLRVNLKLKLAGYKVEPEFTEVWDWVQLNGECCGVDGVRDYGNASVTLPKTCCTPTPTPPVKPKKQKPADLNSPPIHQTQTALTRRRGGGRLPSRPYTEAVRTAVSPAPSNVSAQNSIIQSPAPSNSTAVNQSVQSPAPSNPKPKNQSNSSDSDQITRPCLPTLVVTPHNQQGCLEKLTNWLDHVADILFVLGFCIIAFTKACFLVILRYEIKEMIEKIGLLNDGKGRAMINEMIGLTGGGDSRNNNVVVKSCLE